MTEVGIHGVRLLLLTHYYFPEVGAAQTRLRETVSGLRQRGFQVTVVAAMPSYPLGVVPRPYVWWRPQRERIDGTVVVRLPTAVRPGAGMSRRMIGHGTFALASMASVAIAGRFDVALIESPPLFLALAARVLRTQGLPYVFHVADPWPDFPIAMGYLPSRLERRLAFALEDFAYQGAAAITTVSPGLVDLLSRKPSAEGRVELIANGVDVARFAASDAPAELRRRLGWDEGFTVVYAGTVGRAQGIGTLLEAASLIDERARIRIVGEGVEKPGLEARARTMNLRNVTFHSSVPRNDVPSILAAADAGLVLLRKGPLYEDSHPTKLLETMAASRPVIVAADGLTPRIVEKSGGGYIAAAEDSVGLARAIEACQRDPDRAARGAAGRAYVEQHYERGTLLDRLAEILARASRGT
jgi:glycosyltransferase involved in cell wall biosynthesis